MNQKKKMLGRQHYEVTPEQFITAWQIADSIDEVVEKLGMPKPIVHARASNYRQVGIKLKKMPRKRRDGLDVESLNRLIEQLSQQDDGGPELPTDPELVKLAVKDVVRELHEKIRR
jgi:hypothetical protein